MKKLVPLFIGIFCLMLWAEPGPAMKNCKAGEMPQCGPMHEKFLKQEIGLTDDQQKKLEAIRLQGAKENENVRHEIEVEKLAIKELAVKGSLTKVRLKESLEKIEKARVKMREVRYQGALSALDIFTDEQIKKLAEKRMLNLLLEGREGRGGEGEMGPDCPKQMGKGCPMQGKMHHGAEK